MNPSREAVIARVAEVFPNEDPGAIMHILDQYGIRPFERERNRVQIDILKLSEGDLDKLHEYVRVAKRDYRDVIYWAEYLKH